MKCFRLAYFAVVCTMSMLCHAKQTEIRPIQSRIIPFEAQEKGPHLKPHEIEYHSHHFIRSVSTQVPPLSSSLNWAGYVISPHTAHPRTKSIRQVSGSWTVPTVIPATNKTYSLIWVGMDGYVNHTIEHIGTGQKWDNGYARYFAWFEMSPRQIYVIKDFPVLPGDQIEAFVKYVGNHQFQIKILNLTQSVSFEVPEGYCKSTHAKRSTAEWIVEAPYADGKVRPLTNFGTATFINCWAKVYGKKGSIGGTHWENVALTMTADTGTPTKATTSALSAGGTSFTVTTNTTL